MSTEADIVAKLEAQICGDHERRCEGRSYECTCSFEATLDAVLRQAVAEITKLRAEKEDLLNAAEHFRAERDAAARDMRERAAAVAEYEHHVCAQQSDQAKAAGLRSDMYRFNTALHTAAKIAERIRALPDTPAVIATSGKDAT